MTELQDDNKVIWSKPDNDIAAPSLELFITPTDCLGIKVGGSVIIRHVENWYQLVELNDRYRDALAQERNRVAKLEKYIVDRMLEERTEREGQKNKS